MSFPIPVQLSVAESNVPVNVTLSEQEGVSLGVSTPIERTMTQAEWQALMNDKADIIISSATGEIASFPDGANNLPVVSLAAGVNPAQDLHGYSKPWPAGGGTNLIPLTVDTIKAENGGANTWNGNSKTINGVTFTILTDEAGNVTGINANGTATSFAKLNLGTIHAVSGTTYGIKKFNADDGGNFFGNIKPRFSSATDANITRNTTMTADSDKDVAVSYYIMQGGVANNRLITPFIAVTSIAPTVFAPYSNICPISGLTGLSVYVSPTQDPDDATVYNVEWSTQAGTVYGGTLDVVTGVLTVDMAMVDLGALNWKNLTSGFRTTISGAKYPDTTSEQPNALCSSYPVVSQIQGGTDKSLFFTVGGYVYIKDTRYSDAATFKAAMSGVQLCYELATPLTYQLSPHELKTLKGQNHVWSDAGDVDLTYVADTKLYIDNKIAQAIAAALNS